MLDVLAARRRSHYAASAGCVFWVVFADGCRPRHPLTLRLEGGKVALAVFSHEEEADMFLRSLGALGKGWRIRETLAKEIISLLYGPCCDAKAVALDPLPKALVSGSLSLTALERGRFLRWVTRERQPRVLPDAG
jgi:hypothetical protein